MNMTVIFLTVFFVFITCSVFPYAALLFLIEAILVFYIKVFRDDS